MRMTTVAKALALIVALGAATALPGSAQQDSRWAAFVGCWVPVGAGEDAGLLCFRPAGAGVEMFNVVNGETTATEPLVADGQPRPVSAEGCTGSERVEFSEDGMRAYTRSEFQCGAETRQGSGVMSFVEPNQWIDVRALTVSGEPVAWAQGYELATPERLSAASVANPAAGNEDLIRAARVRASRDIGIEDVEDVVSRVEARAAEVWVAANETPFDLNGDEIVRLADAGVPESVIDVMVAVSFPDRFALTPEGVASEEQRAYVADGYGRGFRGYRSYLWDPYFGPAYGFGYSPYYSRFGYYGYGFGGYGGYWGYVPATIIVRPVEPGDGNVVTPRRGTVVPGRGYVRPSGDNGSGGGVGGARPQSSSGRDSGNDRGGSSGGGGSSGSGGDSGGRRAVPR